MDRAEEESRRREAQELNKRHGDGLTNVFVAECQRLAKLADWDGIGRWTDMIYRCEHLRHSPPVIPFAPIALARAGFIDETGVPFNRAGSAHWHPANASVNDYRHLPILYRRQYVGHAAAAPAVMIAHESDRPSGNVQRATMRL